MLNLKIDNYSMYMQQAVVLLEIQNNYDLAKKYKEINKKYDIE